MIFTYSKTDNDLFGILSLQAENLRHTRSMEVEKEQGFVTVRHDFQKLYIMQEVAPHILAKEGDMVIAYALAMDRVFGTKIPELQAMFSILDSLKFRERNVNKINYVVMGQICVHVDYRGQGVFENLYNYFFNYYQSRYDAVITEIAERNVRSLQAHKKVGFEIIHTYEEKGIEDWVIVAKDITI